MIFWSYERGSWPYDLLVIAIIVFVLASPRSWFHDRPQSGAAVSASVELVSEDPDGQTRTYRVARGSAFAAKNVRRNRRRSSSAKRTQFWGARLTI